jgi:uncharacterized protein (DUF427 family)
MQRRGMMVTRSKNPDGFPFAGLRAARLRQAHRSLPGKDCRSGSNLSAKLLSWRHGEDKMDAVDERSGYVERYDYRVDILRRLNWVTATLDGVVLAESRRTLLVDEQDHGLVFYFPREDVRFDRLGPMPDRSSRCPWKGEASYWSYADRPDEPIAWSYENPYIEVAPIKAFIAFYQDRVMVSVGTAPAFHQRVKGSPT